MPAPPLALGLLSRLRRDSKVGSGAMPGLACARAFFETARDATRMREKDKELPAVFFFLVLH